MSHFADNRYVSISRLSFTQLHKFLFFLPNINKCESHRVASVSVKSGALCNFAFACVFVLSALYSPLSK